MSERLRSFELLIKETNFENLSISVWPHVTSEPKTNHSVFISYSHADLNAAENIEQALKKRGVNVWRDQRSLYAGTRWPRELGEKIAEQDTLLLLWSKHAGQSEFVELEWCTGVALKVQIIPVIMDETPLPAILAAIHGIYLSDTRLVEKIIRALEYDKRSADQQRVSEVLTALTQIDETEPAKVLDAAQSAYEARQWISVGQVYSAGRDIHVTNIQRAEVEKIPGWLQKWQVWVAIAVGMLTAFGILIELPKKIGPYIEKFTQAEMCDLDVVLINHGTEELETSILSIEGEAGSKRWTVPVSAEISISLDDIMYNEWTPLVIWANGDISVFAKQHGCIQHYEGESDDNLAGIRIDAR